MDTVAKLTSEGITDIVGVLEPTSAAFKAIIEKNLAVVTDVRRETFQYGNDDRHQLDIYYPPTAQATRTPILFYVYGGGFVSGERVLPLPFDMAYSCVGAFFARQGFITIIPDYRLASPPMLAAYPEPVKDIRDAILWVLANPSKLSSSTFPDPDVDSILIMAHSAGAAHAGTLLLEPEVLPADSILRTKIKAVVLIAGMYDGGAFVSYKELVNMYYGDKVETHSMLRLLENAKSNNITTLPKILLVEGENEPPVFKEVGASLRATLKAFLGGPVEVIIGQGHNHISMYAALSSGQGEEWAIEASKWMRANI